MAPSNEDRPAIDDATRDTLLLARDAAAQCAQRTADALTSTAPGRALGLLDIAYADAVHAAAGLKAARIAVERMLVNAIANGSAAPVPHAPAPTNHTCDAGHQLNCNACAILSRQLGVL